ncbi:MAG TPA: TonB family protein [Aggregicoccus sp.]|nr:TonB family protein [Aggregicoccus sp.]
MRTVIEEKKTEVVFRPPPPPPPPVVKPAPEPPKPLPRPKVQPKPQVAAAPAPLTAPKEVPLEKPPEADLAHAVAAAPIAVGGTGRLVPGGTATGSADAVRARPMNLPENAQPPRELSSNASPDFPADARRRGQEGMVILKIVVDADGRVSAVKVMRGDEPFVAEAVRAVKSWRYEPARLDGQAISVFRIVKIPFRLKS